MKTVTIRNIRQHWPEVEKLLLVEGELLVTRDAVPVATLSALSAPKRATRERFSVEMHARWIKEIWGSNPPRTGSGKWLEEQRRDRFI